MSSKTDILKKLPRLYRKDRWLNDLLHSVGLAIDEMEADANEAHAQMFADTATHLLPMYEEQVELDGQDKPLADRQSALIARWQAGGKVDIYQIQAAANAWKNGETVVDFKDGKIIVTFVGEFGVPNDMQGLMDAIGIIKPAHLIVEYIFRYLLIKDVHEVMTLAQMEQTQLNKFGH